MNILLTGVTGLLGRHIAKRLSLIKENTIYGIARSVHDEIPNVNYICGEIQDPQTYAHLPDNIEVCIHTAAAIPAKEDLLEQEECIATNIQGTFELVKFLLNRSSNVYIVHISTIYTYKPSDDEVKTEESIVMPGTFYGLSKLYSEAIVLKSNLQSSVLRLASFYDSEGAARSHQRLLYDWIDLAKNGQDLTIWGTGQERRNYLHVNDAVDAILQSIGKRALGVYNIASNETLTTSEIAETILRTVNSESRIVIDSTKSIYAPISGVCIDKAQCELDFQPKISLASGIQSILSYSNVQQYKVP